MSLSRGTHIKSRFNALFGKNSQLQLIRSPGRINLIGEHTDYNEGFVLPTAIDKEIIFAIAPNESSRCNLHALDIDESITFPSDSFTDTELGWAKYLAGIMDLLRKSGISFTGFDCVFGGNIPLGAGLSSSAALCCGFAFSLNELFQLGLSRKEIILMAQETEQKYVGLQCGIMDQYASVFSTSGHVLMIDCRKITHKEVPIQIDGYSFVLINSGVSHQLAESEYNVRRSQCESGVRIIRAAGHNVENLRDVSPDQLDLLTSEPLILRRCKFVLEENQRVKDAANALSKGNPHVLGKLLFRSHQGLQYDYEVTCKETDYLVEAAKSAGALGSRQMGGGFGGCTINLVPIEEMDTFLSSVTTSFNKAFNRLPQVIHIETAAGTSTI